MIRISVYKSFDVGHLLTQEVHLIVINKNIYSVFIVNSIFNG